MVQERCEHHGGFIASVCRRKNAELVKGVYSIGEKYLFEVVPNDTLREGDDREKRSAPEDHVLHPRQNHEANHPLSHHHLRQSIQHQHGQHTEFTLQNEEENQAETSGEKTPAGRNGG